MTLAVCLAPLVNFQEINKRNSQEIVYGPFFLEKPNLVTRIDILRQQILYFLEIPTERIISIHIFKDKDLKEECIVTKKICFQNTVFYVQVYLMKPSRLSSLRPIYGYRMKDRYDVINAKNIEENNQYLTRVATYVKDNEVHDSKARKINVLNFGSTFRDFQINPKVEGFNTIESIEDLGFCECEERVEICKKNFPILTKIHNTHWVNCHRIINK